MQLAPIHRGNGGIMKPYCHALLFVVLMVGVPRLIQAAECKSEWHYWKDGQIIASFPDANGSLTTTINPDYDEAGNPIPWCATEVANIYFSGGGWKIGWAYKTDGLPGVQYPWFYADNYGNVNGVPNGFTTDDYIPPINGYTQLADDQDWIALKTKPIYVSGQRLGSKYENKPVASAPPPPQDLCANYVPPQTDPGQCKQWGCYPDTGKTTIFAADNGTPCDPGYDGYIGICTWGSCQYVVSATNSVTPVKPTTLVSAKEFICNLNQGKVTCSGKSLDPNNTVVSKIVNSTAQITNAVSLSAADNHVCALLNDSTVKCWGQDIAAAASPSYDPYASGPVSATLQDPTTILSASGQKMIGVTQIVSDVDKDVFLLKDGSLAYRGDKGTLYDASGKQAAPLTPFKLLKTVIQIARNLVLYQDHTASGFYTANTFPGSNLIDIGALKIGNAEAWIAMPKTGDGTVSDPYSGTTIEPGKIVVVNNSLKYLSYGYQDYWGYISYPYLGTINTDKGQLITDGFDTVCYKEDGVKPICNKIGSTYVADYYTVGYKLSYTKPIFPIDDFFTEIASTDSSTCIKVTGDLVKCWGSNKYNEMGSFENVVGTAQCLNGKAGCFTNSGKVGVGVIYATTENTQIKLVCGQTNSPPNNSNASITVASEYLACEGNTVKLQFPQASCLGDIKKPNCAFGNTQCTAGGLVQCGLDYVASTFIPFCQNGAPTCIKPPENAPYGTPSCIVNTYSGSGCIDVYGDKQWNATLVCSNGVPTCKGMDWYAPYVSVDPDKSILCESPTSQPMCVNTPPKDPYSP